MVQEMLPARADVAEEAASAAGVADVSGPADILAVAAALAVLRVTGRLLLGAAAGADDEPAEEPERQRDQEPLHGPAL